MRYSSEELTHVLCLYQNVGSCGFQRAGRSELFDNTLLAQVN